MLAGFANTQSYPITILATYIYMSILSRQDYEVIELVRNFIIKRGLLHILLILAHLHGGGFFFGDWGRLE